MGAHGHPRLLFLDLWRRLLRHEFLEQRKPIRPMLAKIRRIEMPEFGP